MRVRELSPRIKLPKFIQDSGIRGGRRGIPKIEAYVAEAGSGIFLGVGIKAESSVSWEGRSCRPAGSEPSGAVGSVKTGMCLKDVAIRILVAQKTVQSF